MLDLKASYCCFAAAAGAFLSRLPAVAPQLVVLDLKNCRGLPGDSIAALLGQLMALQRLTLDGIPEVRLLTQRLGGV